MPAIPDRAYNATCARLASHLGISLASARRKVDMKAAQDGLKDAAGKLVLAEAMLAEALASDTDSHALLTAQLGTVASDAYFMTED